MTCQISRDLFQYSWLDGPTKIYKTEGLSSGEPSRTELATLDRCVEYFSLAVNLISYIYLSGGINTDNVRSNRVQRLDTLTGSLLEMPALIQARDSHSSIAINKKLYAFGGMNDDRECEPSVEILDLVRKKAWEKLLEHPSVARRVASVKSINHEK